MNIRLIILIPLLYASCNSMCTQLFNNAKKKTSKQQTIRLLLEQQGTEASYNEKEGIREFEAKYPHLVNGKENNSENNSSPISLSPQEKSDYTQIAHYGMQKELIDNILACMDKAESNTAKECFFQESNDAIDEIQRESDEKRQFFMNIFEEEQQKIANIIFKKAQ